MTHETGQVPDLAEIADRLAIHEVLSLHSRGVDRSDVAVQKSCYWPDATCEYGAFKGSAHEFCEMLPGAVAHYTGTQHAISNTTIEIRGNEALVESYCTAYHYIRNNDGPDEEMTYVGRYLDRMEKRDKVWKIAHRNVVMGWNQNHEGTSIWEGPPFAGLALSGRKPDDPLYDLLK